MYLLYVWLICGSGNVCALWKCDGTIWDLSKGSSKTEEEHFDSSLEEEEEEEEEQIGSEIAFVFQGAIKSANPSSCQLLNKAS